MSRREARRTVSAESIFINLDVSNREGRLGALPTNHDAEVARAVRLTEDDAGKDSIDSSWSWSAGNRSQMAGWQRATRLPAAAVLVR